MTISSVFPEMRDDTIRVRMEQSQGAVVFYSSDNVESEFAAGSSTELPQLLAAPSNEKTQAALPQRRMTLMWVRLYKEKCGSEDSLVVLFSPILARDLPEYTRIPPCFDKVGRSDESLRRTSVRAEAEAKRRPRA